MSLRVTRPALQNALRSAVVPRAAMAAAQVGKASWVTSRVAPAAHHRAFSSAGTRCTEFESPFGVNSLAKLTEEEEMLREAVRRFAEDVVQPKVEEMDENEKMDPEVIKGLFEQGLMGIETSEELGGAAGSFTAAIIVIEELAKVDASVSVLCDVHNTLVNTVLRKYASKELQQKYLPELSAEKVSMALL